MIRPYLHKGYVQTIRGGSDGYFGVCPSCGHNHFPDRVTEAEAQADVDAHFAWAENEWNRAVDAMSLG